MWGWIATSGGVLPIDGAAFIDLVRPVVAELHRITPQGERPNRNDVAGRIYDALDAAGIGIGITPPGRTSD